MNSADLDQYNLAAYPGGDLVLQGLLDVWAGVESDCALLIKIAEPRLRRLGLPVPAFPNESAPVEHRLYASLVQQDPESAYGQYNALIGKLVSFAQAYAQVASSSASAQG